MAFVDFSEFPSTLNGAARSLPKPLTQLERDVVTLSRRDPVASLERAGAVRGWLRWAFDVRVAMPLADPRLEALRRYAVLLRCKRGEAAREEALRLIGAGYAPEQIAELRAMIVPPARAARGVALPPALATAAMTASRIAAAVLENGPAGLVAALWPLAAGLLASRAPLSPAAARA